MITIKNSSQEQLVFHQHIDETVEGCRVVQPAPGPMLMAPGETICLSGYEPGVSYTIAPRRSPQYPRVADVEDGVIKYRAIAPKGVIP